MNASIEIGTTLIARPWKQGREIDPTRGIVVGPDPFGDDSRVLLWFPKLGVPTTGGSVQPILVAKTEVEGTVEDAPVSAIVEAARTLRRVVRETGMGPEKDEIERWPHPVKARLDAVLKAFNASRRVAV